MVLRVCMCMCIFCTIVGNIMHSFLYVMSLRFPWDVHVEISNIQLSIMINNLASELEIKIEDISIHCLLTVIRV